MSAPLPPHFSSETLDYFLPGYTFFSRAISSVLHIDITPYIPLLLTAGIVYTAAVYIWNSIYHSVWDYFASTAEVDGEDEAYIYLSYWLSRQPSTGNTPKFRATCRPNRHSFTLIGYNNTDSSDEGTDDRIESDLQAYNDFDEYLVRTNSRANLKNLMYTPAATVNHYFRRNGQLFRVMTARELGRFGLLERIQLSCLGRDPQPLKDVLDEAQRLYLERENRHIVIFQPRYAHEARWSRSMARQPRPLSTVILDNTLKDTFMDDVKNYLHPLTRRWYANRGIPYRRGYLFAGPPGCGKTSLCFAAAGELGLKIHVVSLNSRQLSEESLAELFSCLPRKCIVLLEDIDTAGITHTRTKEQSGTPYIADEDNGDDQHSSVTDDGNRELTKKFANDPQGPPGGMSLSALLNTIDGIASTEGRILIMTTNHVENLDPALIRPGRVDMTITFGYASTQTIKDLFRAIYSEMENDEPKYSVKQGRNKRKTTTTIPQWFLTKRRHNCPSEEIARLADDFAAIVPAGKFSPAEIQGYLLVHKNMPREAVDRAANWVEDEKRNVKRRAGSLP